MTTAVLAIALCLWAADGLAQSVLTANPQETLRDYALSECLALALPEIGPEARDYPSQTRAKLRIMKCIDFSRSAEVTRIIQQKIPKTKFSFKQPG